jgi:hypothetical protein
MIGRADYLLFCEDATQNELNRLSISLTREARRLGEAVWVAALSPYLV